MKKIFSLFVAMMAVLAVNASNYYLGGINGSWPEPGSNANFQLTGSDTTALTANFARIEAGTDLKVFVGEGWGNTEYGKASDDAIITPNGDAVVLAAGGGNIGIVLAEGHYLANAVVTFNAATLAISITGTDTDASGEAPTYQLVGACTNNWSTDDAVQFEEVAGVLTATIADLNGTFKIIQDRKWANQLATNWETGAGLGVGIPYVLGGKIDTKEPSNLALANPFGGYHNAVLTLTGMEEGGTPTLTLVSGEFYVTQNNWYLPGSKLGWNINENTMFTPVDGKPNTYEYIAPAFGGDFKVVYGNWAVEFGAQKNLFDGETAITWGINQPAMGLWTPAGNLHCAAGDDVVYTDVVITIEVDYERAALFITLESENATGLNDVKAEGVQKVLENGQVVILKDGVRYNVLGAQL